MNDDDLPVEIHSQTGPWAMVPGWVLHVGLSGNELALYVALRTFAGRSAEAWPRIATLAERAGVSRSTANRALARLRQLDLIRTRTNYRKDGSVAGSVYWLRDVPASNARVKPGSDLHECHGDTGGVSAGDTGGVSPADTENTPMNTPENTEDLLLTADAASVRKPTDAELSKEFGVWWRHYPRKVSKGHALPAYKRARREATAEELLAAVQAFAADPNLPETRLIPHPTTWLNGARWLDGPLPSPAGEREQMKSAWDRNADQMTAYERAVAGDRQRQPALTAASTSPWDR